MEVAFYLVTGLTGSIESSLGLWHTDGTEGPRLNENPWP